MKKQNFLFAFCLFLLPFAGFPAKRFLHQQFRCLAPHQYRQFEIRHQVFTTAGSITKSFKIINENNQKLRLSKVRLIRHRLFV